MLNQLNKTFPKSSLPLSLTAHCIGALGGIQLSQKNHRGMSHRGHQAQTTTASGTSLSLLLPTPTMKETDAAVRVGQDERENKMED